MQHHRVQSLSRPIARRLGQQHHRTPRAPRHRYRRIRGSPVRAPAVRCRVRAARRPSTPGRTPRAAPAGPSATCEPPPPEIARHQQHSAEIRAEPVRAARIGGGPPARTAIRVRGRVGVRSSPRAPLDASAAHSARSPATPQPPPSAPTAAQPAASISARNAAVQIKCRTAADARPKANDAANPAASTSVPRTTKSVQVIVILPASSPSRSFGKFDPDPSAARLAAERSNSAATVSSTLPAKNVDTMWRSADLRAISRATVGRYT